LVICEAAVGFLGLVRAWKPRPWEELAAAIAGSNPARTVGLAAEVSQARDA
jgi:hypothetical protein